MAAMAAGGTRTLSSAVIVFEITQNLDFLVPVLISTVVGTSL